MNSISAKDVVTQRPSRRELKTLGSDIYYLEKRPAENGRTTLLLNHKEILPKEYDIKSKVHEYGGGAYCLSSERLLFVNKKDQQIYMMDIKNGFAITRLTNEVSTRFADGVIDEDGRCSYWVCEKHSDHEVENSLVKISHEGVVSVVHSGQEFYAAPTVHVNKKVQKYKPRKALAFISWNHPNMPWDNTYLHLGSFSDEDGSFTSRVVDYDAWISQPQFNERGDLLYIKELDHGYSNICLYYRTEYSEHNVVILRNNNEYAVPAWNFGAKTYAQYQKKIIAVSCKNGEQQLEMIDKNDSERLLTEYKGYSTPAIMGDNLIIECFSYDKGSELVSLNLLTKEKTILIKAEVPNIKVAEPRSISFPSMDGMAFGFLYTPVDKKENLPLIVISHGGPTGMSTPFFDMSIQYWVDKGFAVFDVNYRGSTGFGKQYRNALKGKWGIYDVADCENAALHCVKEGIANADQLIIRGASAGGYTTMAALTFRNTFKVGASYYGICDLNMLAESTHKFESRYMDSLIANYQNNKEEFKRRSPVNFMDRISCPMIVFQGKEDKVVPPDQAYTIYNNLVSKGIRCDLHIFEEEGHGFGKEENQLTCLNSELEFYKTILKL